MSAFERRTLLCLTLLAASACGADAGARRNGQANLPAPNDAGTLDAADTNEAGDAAPAVEPAWSVQLTVDGGAITHQLVACDSCITVTAAVAGGQTPYVYVWSDGTLQGPSVQVCPKASETLSVTVTDTAQNVSEFAGQQHRGSAAIDLELKDCVAKPGDPCLQHATAGSFDPVVKWSWSGGYSYVTPLVANLTDDNNDGKVDVADIPDIVVAAFDPDGITMPALVVLDGRTGTEHFRIPGIANESTPALGDIDGDKLIDIVMVQSSNSGDILSAFTHTGQPMWQTMTTGYTPTAIALADLDHDGSPEIIAGDSVYDAKGKLLWTVPNVEMGAYESAVAVDLDDDDYMEVIWGGRAYRHDGKQYFSNADVLATLSQGESAFSAVADLDADGMPEIVVSGPTAIFVLDHQGKTLHMLPVHTTTTLAFPPAIHDLDGDGVPEIMVSDGTHYSAYTPALATRWSMPVIDSSGIAAGTAFDFLGDGSAEAMYGDEQTSWGFDGVDGHVIFMQPRTSGTVIEYPSVADVDNDGSADILIVSSGTGVPPNLTPGLQVISDRTARWIPARRILNQDTYHVTNVEEDGTIPTHETPHWKLNNSFRAQAQIGNGGVVCLPKR